MFDSISYNLKLITYSKLSGFRGAARIPPDLKWKDFYFVMFFLVLDSPKDDEYLPTMAEDVEFGEHGWRW